MQHVLFMRLPIQFHFMSSVFRYLVFQQRLLQVLAAQATISSRAPHISYWHNQLIYPLKDSLDANSNAVLIADVSENRTNAHDTMCTLGFAKNAKELVNHGSVGTGAKGSCKPVKDEVACFKAELCAMAWELGSSCSYL